MSEPASSTIVTHRYSRDYFNSINGLLKEAEGKAKRYGTIIANFTPSDDKEYQKFVYNAYLRWELRASELEEKLAFINEYKSK